MLQTFSRLASEYPFWNQTALRGKVRHLMINHCDHGPNDCGFDRSVGPTGSVLSAALHPASPLRKFGFLEFNGVPELSHFQPHLDIRLPSPLAHECGPACGFHERGDSAWADSVVALSPWASPSDADARTRLLAGARRPFRLFWAGLSGSGVRADVFEDAVRERADFVLHDTSGTYPDSPHLANQLGTAAATNTSASGWVARMMAASDFCYSPTGQHDGDSDRYLPSVIYGCVPVFAWAHEVRPLEDVIPWEHFSLRLSSPKDIAKAVDAITDAQLGEMRRVMSQQWPRLLFPERLPTAPRPTAPRSIAKELPGATLSSGEGPEGGATLLDRFARASRERSTAAQGEHQGEAKATSAAPPTPPDALETVFEVLAARMRAETTADAASAAE